MLPQWCNNDNIVPSETCHGLIQIALEKDGDPEHLQYTDAIIVWGDTAAEVFEKAEKIIQNLSNAIFFHKKKDKVKGLAQQIRFLGIKWQDGHHQIVMEVINKITAMSPSNCKTRSLLRCCGFLKNAYSEIFMSCKTERKEFRSHRIVTAILVCSLLKTNQE